MAPPQADQTRVHPRRRPFKSPSSPQTAPSIGTQNASSSQYAQIQLRKGETFHSPTSPPSEDHDPVLSFHSLPRRSPTCPRTLEAIAEGEQRMTEILARLNLDSAPSSNSRASSPVGDDPPVPKSILSARLRAATPTEPPQASLDNTRNVDSSPPMEPANAQDIDSGLGTSIDSNQDLSSGKTKVKAGQLSCANETQSAITSSITAIESGNSERRQLGIGACKQIERYILVPILKDQRLKPFHPLVKSIPKRIVDKEITCLRDLEKTLLFLAPSYSPSKRGYLNFCEVTIQCIHSSTSFLNDRDLRLPTDRPYTNGYFLDLIDQVRRYAAMIERSRDRINNNREPAHVRSKSDNTIREPITLEGGLSNNGRPLEMVVHKDGQAISLRTGEPYDKNASPTIKRSLSINSVDDGVERSMARRKKNAPPMDINKKCKDCDKVFKRPCDLTKHEKTHSRPWKCSYSTCKYHEIGWPTEKERDRHVNDKHSDSPALFKCSFAPCTYQSKRESNCKQHMEKAHGWTYVRSKNNGRQGKKGSPAQATPQTPSVATPASKAVDLPTPATGPSPSPYEAPLGYPHDPPFSFADPPTQNPMEDFQLFSGNDSYGNLPNGVHEFTFSTAGLDVMESRFEAGDPNRLSSELDLHRLSVDSSSVPELVDTTMPFDVSPVTSTDNTSLSFELDWGNFDPSSFRGDFTAMNMQVVTPEQPEQMTAMGRYYHDPSISEPSPVSVSQVPGFSPRASSRMTLTPPSDDEAMCDLYENGYQNKPNDFTLYGQPNMSMGMVQPHGLPTTRGMDQMFPSLPSQGNFPYYQQPSWAGQPLASDLDVDFFA